MNLLIFRSAIFNLCAAKDTPKIFGSGTLANGAAYQIRLLNHKDLPEIYDFHLQIHASLQENEKTFISRKEPEDFEAYLNGKGAILGVICENKLIGLGCINMPKAGATEFGMADMKLDVKPETVAIMQSDSVLPAWRGNNLQQRLTEARCAFAGTQGRRHVLALADTKNLATIKTFLNVGMAVVGMGTDPDDGGKIFHMRGKIPAPSWSLFPQAKRKLG